MVIGLFLIVISPILAFYEMIITKQLENFINRHHGRQAGESGGEPNTAGNNRDSVIVCDQNDLPCYNDVGKVSSPVQYQTGYPRRLDPDQLDSSGQTVLPSYNEIIRTQSIHSNKTQDRSPTVATSSRIHSH